MQAALHVRKLLVKKGERETVGIMCSVCPFLYAAEALSNSLCCGRTVNCRLLID
jgi:hypothetical protein